MKSLVKTQQGPGHVELIDFEIPENNHDDEVLIDIEWVGICGTDISIYRDIATTYDTPMVLGHELSGIVSEVGKDVTKFKPGDKVTVETSCVTCGQCKVCKAGAYNVCKERLGMGRTFHGAFRKTRWFREPLVHRLTDDTKLDEAALCEPAAVTYHAVNVRGKVQPGENVYIFGVGPIGILTAQFARIAGGEVTIVGLGCDREKLKMCESYGCRPVCLDDDPVFVQEADVVFDCSGAQASLNRGIEILNPRGRYVQVGLFRQDPTIPMNIVNARELEVYGTYSTVSSDFENVTRLLGEGRVDFKSLISGKFSIDDWEKAFEMAMNGDSIKVLIQP